MSQGSVFTTESGAGSGGASGDFVTDNFVDTVLQPTNNTGLTDTASTNPFGVFVANAESVSYGLKTLWIKSYELIEDRSKWIGGFQTFKVIFHEDAPEIFAYFASPLTVQPTNLYESYRDGDPNLKPLSLADTSRMIFGVTGRMSRMALLVGTAGPTAAHVFVDGVDTGTVTYSNVTRQNSNFPYSLFYSPAVHKSSNETDDLHDIRWGSPSDAGLAGIIHGIQVYFENSGNTVNVGPGVTYNDKNKLETTSGVTFAAPSFGNSMGGIALYSKLPNDTYATYPVSCTTVATIAQGSSGTNLLSVSSGHGASFPSGSGIVIDQGGGSFYVGSVLSVSTDTLTVGPTLPFGISQSMYRSWQSSATLAINASLFVKTFTWDASLHNGFSSLVWSFADPINNINVMPSFASFSAVNTINPALYFASGVGGIRCFGDFSAADVEIQGTGLSCFTSIGINGCFGYTMTTPLSDSAGSSSLAKIVAFSEAGTGCNLFTLDANWTGGFPAIRRINFYKRATQGATIGLLGSLENNQAFTDRSVLNSTLMALGLDRRVVADQVGYTGLWTRTDIQQAAGNVRWASTANNASFNYQWYGKNIGIVGQIGTSSVLTIDGVSVAPTFNQMLQIGSEGWHTLQYIHRSGTSRVEAIDVARTYRDVKSLKNHNTLPVKKKKILIVNDFGNIIPYVRGSTTDPTPSATATVNHMHVRRVGKYMELEYRYHHSVAGDAGSGTYWIVIPFGLTADSKYVPMTSDSYSSNVGYFFSVGSGSVSAFLFLHSTSLIRATGLKSGGTSVDWDSGSGSDFGQTDLSFGAFARIPIAEWDDYEEIEFNDG